MLGLQLAMICRQPWRRAAETFLALQEEFPLQACELHLDTTLYEAAVRPDGDAAARWIRDVLRPAVDQLGVHLPFFEMNPICANPSTAQADRERLRASIDFAGQVGADYAVFHARGERPAVGERAKDVALWRPVITALAEKAHDAGVLFCLENADDLSGLERIERVLAEQAGSVKLCLDVGHLYERAYPRSRGRRRLLVLNDRLSPVPFLCKRGLPVAPYGDWRGALVAFRDHLACLHLHNHDGKIAHQPLTRGKIDLEPLREFRGHLDRIPIILEADYRDEELDVIRQDIHRVQTLLEP